MTRVAFLILLVLASAHAQAVRSIIPRPEPDPARLDAARRFVAALPIAEGIEPRPNRGETMRAGLMTILHYEAAGTFGAGQADLASPSFARIVLQRADGLIPRVLPAAREDIARQYAFAMSAPDLDAAARFLATPEGRGLAARIVAEDRVVFEAIRSHIARALAPELGAILAYSRVAEVERLRAEAAHDVLRQRVNAAARRRRD